MTFDGDNFGRDNLGDDGFGGDYDPVIAERFALLDRLEVPDYGARANIDQTATVLPLSRPRFDPTYALAVAAAFLVIAAASYLALRPTTDLGLDATNDGTTDGQTTDDNSNQSAAVQDGDAGSGKLTVEVAPSSTAPSQAGAAASEQEPAADTDESGDANTTDEATTTTATTAPADTETTTATESSTASTTTTSIVIDRDSIFTPPPTKPIGPGVTVPDVPQTTFVADGPATVVVRGTLTELFTDCEAHYVLGPDGEVEQQDTISCDGGSYVVVDGRTIRTSAGNSPASQYYDKHDPALRPGQQVVVSATAASQASAALTLNCAQCGITLGG